MQSNRDLYTGLQMNHCWAVYVDSATKCFHSNGLEDLADALGMQIKTLTSLLAGTSNGQWPVHIGGRLLQASSFHSGSGGKTVLISEISPEQLMLNLQSITGEELQVLTSFSGKVLAASAKALEMFPGKNKLSSMFDSSSSGAIEAALLKCSVEGFVHDFLVSSTEKKGNRTNYSIKMRNVPAPGRLVLSQLSIPSVAVVTGTMDRNNLINVLLEESFCPSIILDSKGIVKSMNTIARDLCLKYWQSDPTGKPVFNLVHPDQQSSIIQRHEQRVRGFAVPSRYSVKLNTIDRGSDLATEISVVPLHNLDRWVVFIRPPGGQDIPGNSGVSLYSSESYKKLNMKKDISPEEILLLLVESLKAKSAAWITDSAMVTAGDSTNLMTALEGTDLAAAGSGFIDASTYIHRIDFGFGLSHLVVRGLSKGSDTTFQMEALQTASRILDGHQVRAILKEERKILALMRDIATAYLKRTETLDGLLADFARGCGAETAAVFRVARNGSFLQGIAGAGMVGDLPDLPLETLNTASWACLRGETAFYTESPEGDLRFARVFRESLSELAVPFFSGTTPEGAILIASAEKKRFTPSAAELAGLLALLFTVPEGVSINENELDFNRFSNPLKDLSSEVAIHHLSALQAAVHQRADFLAEGANDTDKQIKALLESVNRLGFYSRWTLWFLRASLYGGRPDQKWMDPVPLLEKTLIEFHRFADPEGMKLEFIPPMSDIEVCTDGAFVSMIARSFLMCILENCQGCEKITLKVQEKGDHWTFGFDCLGNNIPGECLSTARQPDNKNASFSLAWKLTEELGGTVSTFSSMGKSTRMVTRLRISG